MSDDPKDPKDELLARFYTRKELAKKLNRTPRTLDRGATLGEGPPITRIGRQIFYRKVSAEAWLTSLEGDA